MQSYLLKIERAKELLEQLRGELRDFLDSEPYKIGIKRNTEKKPIYYISDAAALPPRIALLSGEIIQHLRSALDNLAYSLFQKESAGQEGKHIYFPISEDLSKYSSEKERKLRVSRTRVKSGLTRSLRIREETICFGSFTSSTM